MTTADNGARLADEIRLLVDLIVERAAPWLDSLVEEGHGTDAGQDHTGGNDPGGNDTGGTGAAERGWCPLCAVLAICRGERVDVAARLVDQLTQLLALLRAVLADRWHPHEGVHVPGAPAPRPERDRREPSRVQHVPVRPRARGEPDADGGR